MATQSPVQIARPERAQFKKISECVNIQELLAHPDMVSRFKQALPRHMTVERMLRMCVMAVSKTPGLGECNLMSLAGAMLTLSSLGLEPNTPLGHAYLIPFAKRAKVNGKWQQVGTDVQVVLGYRGLLDLSRRSGQLASIHADVVYEGDDFSFEYGSNQHIRHVPKGGREGRKPLWCYAHAKLKDGEAFEVLPYPQVLAIRNASAGYQQALRAGEGTPQFAKAPWIAFEHEMACKTVARRLFKWIPASIEMASAATIDESDAIDFGAVLTADAGGYAEIAAETGATESVSDESPSAPGTAAPGAADGGAVEGSTKPQDPAPPASRKIAVVSANGKTDWQGWADAMMLEIAGAVDTEELAALDQDNHANQEAAPPMHKRAIRAALEARAAKLREVQP